MNPTLFSLISTTLAIKFLVEVSYLDQELLGFKEDTEIIDFGDLKILVVDYDEKPLFMFQSDSVLSIEEDSTVSIDEDNLLLIQEDFAKQYFLQSSPPWNLDRMDQKKLPLNEKYYYRSNAGEDTDVYIVDTGIDVSHPEFGGRAVWGGNFVDKVDTDCNAHGTHVAGTVGSKNYGVSKGCNLIAVKVLGCNGGGTYSGILKGLEYVINRSKSRKVPSIVNMSLGGPKSKVLDKAIESLINAGIHIIVAAGNSNEDACDSSPSSSDLVLTVGATTPEDTKAGFSNWGKCVDILSPGTKILSTIPNGKVKIMQGTSMASPAVAGVYSLILANNRGFTPATMKRIMTRLCTKGEIKNLDSDTANCLLFSLI